MYYTFITLTLIYWYQQKRCSIIPTPKGVNVSIDETKYTPPLEAIHPVNGLFPFKG